METEGRNCSNPSHRWPVQRCDIELRLEQGATPEMRVESILNRKNSEGKDQDRNNSANLKNSMKANMVGP